MITHKKLKAYKIGKIILILTIVLLVLFTSVICLSMNVWKQSIVQADYSYTITSAGLSDDNYNNYSEFRIGEINGLKKFCELVQLGKNFENKTVNLTADINCNSADIQVGKFIRGAANHPFCGCFDGNNYCLQNIKLSTFTSETKSDNQHHIKQIDRYAAIFPSLDKGGTVKRLKVSGVSLSPDLISTSGSKVICHTGFVLYGSSGIIDNCIIEGVETFSYALSATVPTSNCLIINTNADTYFGDNCSKCVKYNSGSSYSFSSDINNTSQLDSDYWHVPPTSEFNNGRPMLKSFMELEEINISVGAGQGSVDSSSIKLPKDMNGESISYNYTSNQMGDNGLLQIYDKEVVATPNIGYVFDNFSVNLGSKSIVVNFKLRTYQVLIKIYDSSNQLNNNAANITASYGSTNVQNQFEFSLTNNTVLNISSISINSVNPECYYIEKIVTKQDDVSNTINSYNGNLNFTVSNAKEQSISIYIKLKTYTIEFD